MKSSQFHPRFQEIIDHALAEESLTETGSWKKPKKWGFGITINDNRSPEERCLQHTLKMLGCTIENYKISSISIPFTGFDYLEDLTKMDLEKFELGIANTLDTIKQLAREKLQLVPAFSDETIIFKTALKKPFIIDFIHPDLKKDKDFIFALVLQNANALQFADKSLKDDKKFILPLVKQNGLALQFVDERLKNDLEVVIEAIKNCPDSWFVLGKDLKAKFSNKYPDTVNEFAKSRRKYDTVDEFAKSSEAKKLIQLLEYELRLTRMINSCELNLKKILYSRQIEEKIEFKEKPHIELTGYLDLFDKINFDKPEQNLYFDPEKLKNDVLNNYVKISKNEVRNGLGKLIDYITNRKDHIAVPKDKKEREEWYQYLENILKTNLELFTKTEDKGLVFAEVIRIGIGGTHCGDRWRKDALDLHRTLTGRWITSSMSYESLIQSWLDSYKEGVVEELVRKLSSSDIQYEPHIYNCLGKALISEGILFSEIVSFNLNDSTSFKDKSVSDKYVNAFINEFTKTNIVLFIQININDWLKSKTKLNEKMSEIDNMRDVLRGYTEKILSQKMKELEKGLEKMKYAYGKEKAKEMLQDAQMLEVILKATENKNPWNSLDRIKELRKEFKPESEELSRFKSVEQKFMIDIGKPQADLKNQCYNVISNYEKWLADEEKFFPELINNLDQHLVATNNNFILNALEEGDEEVISSLAEIYPSEYKSIQQAILKVREEMKIEANRILQDYPKWLKEPEKFSIELKKLGTEKATQELRDAKNQILDAYIEDQGFFEYEMIEELDEEYPTRLSEVGTIAFLTELEFIKN